MSNKAIMSMIGTVIVAAGLLASNNAEATVRIRAFGIDICFTGKKNPHGCDTAKTANRGMQVVVLEDEVMAKMERMKGQTVKVEAVPALDAASKERGMLDDGGQTTNGGAAPNTPDTLDASQRGIEKSDIRRGMNDGEASHRNAKFKAGKALADTVKRNGNVNDTQPSGEFKDELSNGMPPAR